MAVSARLRSGAGKHKDSRTPRGGSRNEFLSYLIEYEESLEDSLHILEDDKNE